MEQNAERHLPTKRRFSTEVVPTRGARETAATQEGQKPGQVHVSMTELLRERAGNLLITTKVSIAGVYRIAHKCVSYSFMNLSLACRGAASQARNRAEHLKRDYPLQLLAAVMGAAFAIGMAVRLRLSPLPTRECMRISSKQI